jgi:antitoxin ParD1/3/4
MKPFTVGVPSVREHHANAPDPDLARRHNLPQNADPGTRSSTRSDRLRPLHNRRDAAPAALPGIDLTKLLAKFAIAPTMAHVTTMNVSLPDELKNFVDTQVGEGSYGSTSEYVRNLIRQAQDRDRLRAAILEGAASPVAANADDFIDSLRARITRI